MQTFEDIPSALEGITQFRIDHNATIPAHILDRWRSLTSSPSPVESIVGIGELVWANRDQFSEPAWNLAAGLIQFADLGAWHGLRDDGRGTKIVANFRKMLGEIQNAPAAPEPRAGFVIADPATVEPDPDPATPEPEA